MADTVANGKNAPVMGAPDILQVDRLHVGYGDGPDVLRDVTLRVPDQGAVAVIGANGAGKTTLVRALSGLLSFHSGQVRSGTLRLGGDDVATMSSHEIVRRGVAQVPEGRMVFNHLTVEENLRIGSMGGTAPREFAESAAQIYDLFPILGDRRRQQAGWMSGGEQQMVAIGRALMARPSLMLLDEVSLGLAPRIISDIVASLERIRRDYGTAFLVVEQNATVALELSDTVHIMERGQLIEEDVSDGSLGERIRGAYLGE